MAFTIPLKLTSDTTLPYDNDDPCFKLLEVSQIASHQLDNYRLLIPEWVWHMIKDPQTDSKAGSFCLL